VLRSLRQNINDLIARKASDVAVKQSLARQSALFDALETLAVKGEKEIGTTGTQRFFQNHPSIRGLVNTAKSGVAAGLGLEGAQRLFPD